MLTFYLPRFQDQTFSEKMITVFHELYHISPEFNGDIRRLPGRCYVHSMSEKEYDLLMARYVREYLAHKPTAGTLRLSQNQIHDPPAKAWFRRRFAGTDSEDATRG
ncbi:MAG: hypothetical protein R3C11_09205 [Planctomycetaceae bacterium]